MSGQSVLRFNMSDPRLWVPVYLPLLGIRTRRKILYGSRDSAKSYFAAQCCIRRMIKEPTKGLLIRKTFESIRKSVFDTIHEVVAAYGWEDYFEFGVAPMEIRFIPNGSRMIALGLDKPGKAKSVKDPAFAWYEEVDELTMEDYMHTTLSLRGKNIEEYLTFNSTSEDHWLLQRFFPGALDDEGTFHPDLSFERPDGMHTFVPSTDPTTTIVHTCYKHNPYCGAERRIEYERMEATLPDVYPTVGLGLFGAINLGSIWARHFLRSKHVAPRPFKEGLPIHLTFDQNYLPYSTMLMIQIEKVGDITEVRIVREFCLAPPSNSTEDLCAEFTYDYGDTRPMVYYYGDPTGSSRSMAKTRGEMKNHYHVVETELAPFLHNSSRRVSKAPPSIKGRKYFMSMLLSDNTYLRLFIDPSCVNTIRDFERLVEDENGGYVKRRVTDKDTGQSWEEGGHCMDALINFLFQCFPDLYRHYSKV